MSEPSLEKAKVDDRWKGALAPDPANFERVCDVWKQTVAVQMHFNDICMKIRSLASSVLVGAIGLAAYATKENVEIDLHVPYVGNLPVPVSVVIDLAGLAGWLSLFAMDRHWYHNFLTAAGRHAGEIEARWSNLYPELQLSSRIGEASRTVPQPKADSGWWDRFAWRLRKRYWPDSSTRLTTFYKCGACIFGLAFFVFLFHPHLHSEHDKKSTASIADKAPDALSRTTPVSSQPGSAVTISQPAIAPKETVPSVSPSAPVSEPASIPAPPALPANPTEVKPAASQDASPSGRVNPPAPPTTAKRPLRKK